MVKHLGLAGRPLLQSCSQHYLHGPAARPVQLARMAKRPLVVCQAVDASLNPRVAALKPSKTVALTDLALSLKQQGIDVIGLAAGEPDFDTPAVVAEAGRQAITEGVTRYSPNVGTLELRKAICGKLEAENGLKYAPEEVVLSNGAKQSIWQSVLAACGPGDEVIVPAPYWVSYVEMVRLAGATPVVVETTAEEGYMLTPEKLKAAMTPNSRLIILCTPSNPTGAVYSRSGLEALAEVVAEHPKLLVMSDEIYEHIIYPPAEHVSFGTLPGMFERTLTINGFSKAFAMCGWRLGYVAAPRHFAKACSIIQSQCTSGPSSIAQKAALAALEMGPGGGEPVAAMKKEYQGRRDYIVQRLLAINGIKIAVPEGAFYVLPDMSAFFGPGVSAEGFGEVPDSDALCRYFIEVARVALVPGEAFGSPSTVRISYAASMDTITKAMDRLEEALQPGKFTRA